MSNVFKTKGEQAEVKEPVIESKTSPMAGVTNVEVPYLDYEPSHGKPFTVDYFNLGNTWRDLQGGFPKEVELIEEYIEEKVKSAEIANDTKSVKTLLKNMEKLTNIKDEPRTVIKIETLAHYIEFLRKAEGIKTNLRRLYG